MLYSIYNNKNIVANANTVTVPSTLLTTHNVYYKDNSGTFKRLTAMPYKQLVAETGANNFFNTSYTGDPIYYTSRGTSLVFNRYFNRTETAAIKVDGVTAPTTLSSDSDTTELPVDYDMLITYFSAEHLMYFFVILEGDQLTKTFPISKT